MKLMLFLIAMATFAANAFAYDGAEMARRLGYFETHRTATHWTCKNGDHFESVVLFYVDGEGAASAMSSLVLAIKDPQICYTLHTVCPFVAPVYDGRGIGNFGARRYAYLATLGQHETAYEFHSQEAGMMITAVELYGGPRVRHDLSWYFNPGDCYLN